MNDSDQAEYHSYHAHTEEGWCRLNEGAEGATTPRIAAGDVMADYLESLAVLLPHEQAFLRAWRGEVES